MHQIAKTYGDGRSANRSSNRHAARRVIHDAEQPFRQRATHLSMLTTYEPEFLRFGYSLFVAFATILIVWEGG